VETLLPRIHRDPDACWEEGKRLATGKYADEDVCVTYEDRGLCYLVHGENMEDIREPTTLVNVNNFFFFLPNLPPLQSWAWIKGEARGVYGSASTTATATALIFAMMGLVASN